jgi:hypothetical protein
MKLSPVEAKVSEIEAALRECMSSSAAAGPLDALIAAAPYCLGPHKDERHKFQEEAAAAIGEAFEQRRTCLEEAVNEAQADFIRAESTKQERHDQLSEAQKALEAKQAVGLERKAQLATDARTFQAAKAAHQEEKTKADGAEYTISSAARKKDDAETLIKQMDNMHQDVDRMSKFIGRLEVHVAIDDSEKTAIPCALSKAPESRGAFDGMVITQLVDKLNARVAELQQTMDNGDAMKAEHVKCVQAAFSTLDAAKAAQMASAGNYTAAADATAAAEAEVKLRKKDVAAATKQLKSASDALTGAQVDLDRFKGGPLGAFQELLQRSAATTPQPEAVPAAEPTSSTPSLVAVA